MSTEIEKEMSEGAIDDMIQRLKKESVEELAAVDRLGRDWGIAWAKDYATRGELARMEREREEEGFASQSWQDFAQGFASISDMDDPSEEDELRDALCDDSETRAFILAFAGGALDAWKAVKNRL